MAGYKMIVRKSHSVHRISASLPSSFILHLKVLEIPGSLRADCKIHGVEYAACSCFVKPVPCTPCLKLNGNDSAEGAIWVVDFSYTGKKD